MVNKLGNPRIKVSANLGKPLNKKEVKRKKMDRKKVIPMVMAMAITAIVISALVPVSAAYTYNRQDAVDYALDNWNSNVPGYWWFNMNDGDCTNFVSWCLYEGGWTKQDPQWYSYWPYWNSNSHSNSWTCVGAFDTFAQSRGDRTYLGNNPDTVLSTVSSLISSNELQEGDVIQRLPGTYPAHTMIVTGIAGNTAFVTYHSENTYYENFRYFVTTKYPDDAEYISPPFRCHGIKDSIA